MIVFFLAVLGFIFGSFVNAVTWRLHEQSKLVGKRGKSIAKRRQALSISTGRSMCSKCGHQLAAKDLVPVVSWVWLRGKCRYCHVPIEDNPLVELSMGVLFASSYVAWPYDFHSTGLLRFGFWLVFLVGFMLLAVYDLRWFLLPDKIVFPLSILAGAQVVLLAVMQHSLRDLWEPAAGALVIFGLFWLLYQVSQGTWIGGGDVKLAIVLGLLSGTPFRALTIIFFASFIGTIVSIPQLLKGKTGFVQRIPFGPPLLLATTIVVLYGDRIAYWYQGLIFRQ